MIEAPATTDGVPRNYNLQRLHAKGVLPTQADNNLVKMLFVHDSVGMISSKRLSGAIRTRDLNFIGFLNPITNISEIGLYRVTKQTANMAYTTVDLTEPWSGTDADDTYNISIGQEMAATGAFGNQSSFVYFSMDFGSLGGGSVVNQDKFSGGFLWQSANDGWFGIQSQGCWSSGNPLQAANYTIAGNKFNETGLNSAVGITDLNAENFNDFGTDPDDSVGFVLQNRGDLSNGDIGRPLGWYIFKDGNQTTPDRSLPGDGLYYANVGAGGMNADDHINKLDQDVVDELIEHIGGYEVVMIKLSLNPEPTASDKADNIKAVAQRWIDRHAALGYTGDDAPEILIINSYQSDGSGSWTAQRRAEVWDMIRAEDYALIDLWGLYGGESPGLLSGYTMDGGGTGVHPDDAATAENIMQDILNEMDPARFVTLGPLRSRSRNRRRRIR